MTGGGSPSGAHDLSGWLAKLELDAVKVFIGMHIATRHQNVGAMPPGHDVGGAP